MGSNRRVSIVVEMQVCSLCIEVDKDDLFLVRDSFLESLSATMMAGAAWVAMVSIITKARSKAVSL